jgi:hypothetical protein
MTNSNPMSYQAALVAANYLQQLVQVIPAASTLFFSGGSTCGVGSVPTAHQTGNTGVPSTDLVIYTYTSGNILSGYASGAQCLMTGTNGRPTFGYVDFNQYADLLMSASVQTPNFVQYMKSILHEMLRVLGLDATLASVWRNPSTLLPYTPVSSILNTTTVRSKSTRVLWTPNILAAVRTQFGCTTAPGVQLENDESTTTQSNLERTVFRGEIMSSGQLFDLTPVSAITAGWLLDTGWYYSINSSFL